MIKHTALTSLLCRRVYNKLRSSVSELSIVKPVAVHPARQYSSFEEDIDDVSMGTNLPESSKIILAVLEDFEGFKKLKVQQIPEQDIPVPIDSTAHEVMNFFIQGYDCTSVEHFAQYTHNLAKNMDLKIFDSYAVPTKNTLVHTIHAPGTAEKLKPRDFTLAKHQRVVQLQELQGIIAPIFLEMLQVNLPEGVTLSVEPHSQYHHKERYIQKEIPRDLL